MQLWGRGGLQADPFPFAATKIRIERGPRCCYGRRGNDLPRPILIFFAATENGFACSGSRDDELPRPILIFVAARKNGFVCSSSTKTAKIEVEIGQVLQ